MEVENGIFFLIIMQVAWYSLLGMLTFFDSGHNMHLLK